MTADAQEDLEEAVAWYEGKRKGLGKKLTKAVRTALTQLRKLAEVHAKIWGDVRQVSVPGFKPYVMHYLVKPDQVTVLSVFHTHRNPRIWRLRI